MVSYLEKNDNKQITISDLVNKMQELCGDSYSVTYNNEKKLEHFRESIIITEINGKQNVATLRNTASSILQDFISYIQTLGCKEVMLVPDFDPHVFKLLITKSSYVKVERPK